MDKAQYFNRVCSWGANSVFSSFEREARRNGEVVCGTVSPVIKQSSDSLLGFHVTVDGHNFGILYNF